MLNERAPEIWSEKQAEVTDVSRVPLDEAVKLFGVGNIVRFPVHLGAAREVPQSTKDVLVDVGLPHHHEFFSAAVEPRVTKQGLCRIGDDYGTDICVDEVGRVLSISESGQHPDRFINSDLAAFVRFLALTAAERARLADRSDDEETDAMVEELASALAEIDAEAFADPDNWWSVIFEQMRDHLL